jgi:hypothetical protein
MSPPQANTLLYDSGRPPDYPVRFRFRVTWTCLSAKGTSPRTAAPETHSVFTAPAPPAIQPQQAIVPRPRAHAKDSAAQWEMVIPKMARPAPRTAPPPPAKPAPAPVNQSTPALYMHAEPYASRIWKALSLEWKYILIPAVLLGGGMWAWRKIDTPKPVVTRVETPARVPDGGWVRKDAYLAGARQGRQIVLYGPTRDESNYRIEFSWIPDAAGVGLVFRVRDTANYYAGRLRLVQSKPSTALTVEHFAVSNGIEGRHSEKTITLLKSEPSVRVRQEASGPVFTLYVQDSPVDYWTDQRFTAGGLGFFEERKQQANVQSIRFALSKKSAQTVEVPLK